MAQKDIVWRLLRHNISAGQMIGYAAANFIGLTIVVAALQFYSDLKPVFDGKDSFMTRDLTVISKKVSGLGSIVGSGSGTTFTHAEISELEAQPWVRRVAAFTPATFNVAATADMDGVNLSTALFLESVPDDMFDVRPEDWGFDPSEPVLPVIISKDYLSLYNFGFASSRGLPQLSEAMIGLVPLRISVSGNGRQQWIPAHIVGFSSRLNTIAVPEEFMKWANSGFGEDADPLPSRLIVDVNRPGNPAINEFLSAHDYETAGDKADNAKASYFLSVVTGIVLFVGGLICVLSFFILMLSIYLLMQKNRNTLGDLMSLGYSPDSVARYYYVMVAGVNLTVLLLSIATLFVGKHFWSIPLSALGITGGSLWPAVGIAVAVIGAITVINVVAIRHTMLRYFSGK